MNFDPMTGEPINKPNEEEMKFDPMTGEPIEKAAENTVENEMNFDPMTGQPIGAAAGNTADSEMKFDPMTGLPIGSSNGGVHKFKGGKLKAGLAIAAGVVVVGGVVYAGMNSGAFLGKGNKVLLAATKTFSEENHLAEDLANVTGILASGKYTVAVKGAAEDAEIDVEYRDASSKKQIKGMIDDGYMEVEFDAAINDKKLAVQIPSVDDRVFVYNYTEENDGYLVDELGEDTVESVNELLETICSEKEQKKLVEDLTEAVLEEYKNLEFKKAEKEEYEVNGKDRKCKGYETTITSDNMLNILDDMEEILGDEYEDALEKADVDLGDAFSEMRQTFRSMPDIDVTFYLYKNKLACINMDVDGDDAEILFLGGDTRTQNMKFRVERETVLEIKGSTESGVEKTRVYVDDKEYCELKYDYKGGKFTIDASELYLSGTIDAGRNGVTLTLKDVEVDGDVIGFDGEISITKGAKVELPSGEEFDLGNASKSDFEDLSESLNTYSGEAEVSETAATEESTF